MKDVDNPKYKDTQLGCLSEDGIWNILISLEMEKVDLIKSLVKKNEITYLIKKSLAVF